MAGTYRGPITWGLTRDSEGHREYSLTSLVETDAGDGPYAAMTASGLPSIGSPWTQGNDTDLWALCRPDAKVSPHQEKKGDKTTHWQVKQLFSTRPLYRCQDEEIEDPLMEPQKVGGSFVKYLEEASRGRNGDRILSSAGEMVRGPNVEFDANRPTVRIEQNVASLGLNSFSQMIDTVNDAVLWGLGTRRVKLSNVSWERRLYGVCDFYYTRIFDFDIRFDTFDRTLEDEGTMALGRWKVTDPVTDPPEWEVPSGWVVTNPNHITRYTDVAGNPARCTLDGSGVPWDGTGDPGTIDVEKYGESNFLLLGIPTSF